MASDWYHNNTHDLFRRVAMGDERAFKSVFDGYWPQVYGTSLRLTRSPEQAKDLAQDIFIKLWENRVKLGEVQNPASYIYIISRNLVMDYLRKKVFDPSNIDFLVGYFNSNNSTPQEKMELRELEDSLHQAIETLPGKIKEVFKLSRFEGLTHEQIAARLNISVVSSKTYIVRALQQIRDHLATQPDSLVIVWLIGLLILGQ